MRKTYCDICNIEVGSHVYLVNLNGPDMATENHEVCKEDYRAISNFIFERKHGKTRDELFGPIGDLGVDGISEE